MEITVNGKLQKVSESTNISQLLKMMGLIGKRLAVEVNLKIVPSSQHDEYILKENDRVEIVHAIGGG